MKNRLYWALNILMALATAACDVTEPDEQGAVPAATAGIYVLCEGVWGQGNASLWYSSTSFDSVSGNIVNALTGEDLGDTGQSLYQHDNILYIVLNASNKIVMLDLSGDTIAVAGSVDLPGASPREMVIVGDRAYVSAWNLAGLAVIDLITNSVDDTIPLGGLPEDVLASGSHLYVAMTMDEYWVADNKVLVVDVTTNTVTDTLIVGNGPNQLLLQNGQLYVARQWYDDTGSQRGITRVDLNSGMITIVDWGTGGGIDIFTIDGQLYSATGEGVVSVNPDLTIGAASYAGSLPIAYSAGTDGSHILIGSISDYESPGEVAVYEIDGTLVETFNVGVNPGSFLSYTRD